MFILRPASFKQYKNEKFVKKRWFGGLKKQQTDGK
jgi:hypothetical protein